ncbi:MAG: hypothetical protein J6C19_00320 [Lachnospiraceae bacterium]|nr:hypothetical protein [Lachnospiraceae bacterium]MBO5143966.1 hypothetical protein [Lachnospiraceae bacterium]
MEIIRWAILLVLVLPVPFFLGFIPVKHMNSLQRTPAMTYVCGWFVSFFLFEVTAVPFILLEKSFTMVVAVYTCIIAVLLLISLWQGRELWKDYAQTVRRALELPGYVKLGWAVVVLLILFQMFYAVRYEYYDGDDAYYIATSVLTDTFDSMYLRDAYTGYLYPLDIRHAFSPTPIYQAWLSRLSGIAPAVVAHTVLAPVWLLFMYCIYAQIGNRLLWNKRSYRPVFMLLITLWFSFGNISLYTSETFAMTRTWQGKGLMAGMVVPALFLCLIYLAQEKASRGIWMLFVCVCLSAVFATSVSFMLIPTVTGAAAVLTGVRNRSLRHAAKVFACCIPCLLLAVCYLLAAR